MRAPRNSPPLEIWGGVECTVNRVGDRYFDQTEASGHAERLDDLDRFAELGIKALRYPILWERTAPGGPETADWTWADERLGRLRELGIRPIVTLVHHGSGPRHTNLLDDAFVDGLAAFAGAVATRYPWVEDYTPINEPLTTARFSALYGHWYPHAQDTLIFVRALMTECSATAEAMRAIRAVNPSARLIQTEDIGKTHSTAKLAYQARHENMRRWLSLDLLTGRLKNGHPLWGWLYSIGFKDRDFERLGAAYCPPDLIGVNYYITSERFLDDALELYPSHVHGGNGQDRYADVEAVRVRAEGIAGFGGVLREVWERYKLPMAITEVHIGADEEDQLRWLAEAWQDANAVRREGADIAALTVWSLLGAFGWRTLVTSGLEFYEPGVFDLSGDTPRPTPLATLVRDLATGRPLPVDPVRSPGWWRRPDRFVYPPRSSGEGDREDESTAAA